MHARIERRRDKFFLVDQSTNGTFVTFAGEAEIALRREEVMLRNQGRITFGHSMAESSDETVDFARAGLSIRPFARSEGRSRWSSSRWP